MDSKNAIKNILVSVNRMIDDLSKAEFEKLGSDEYELSLVIRKKKTTKESKGGKSTLVMPNNEVLEMISLQLNNAKTREDGIAIIESSLSNKAELEALAKYIDVAVMKSDKADVIKRNIVDATVGARLRSSAIQGKEI